MSQFKFFEDNEPTITELIGSYEGASWMWAEETTIGSQDYEVVTQTSNGIRGFLDLFDRHEIVPIVSITGNGRTHNYYNQDGNNGWGFNILEERLFIRYIRYRTQPILTRQRIEDEERLSRRLNRIDHRGSIKLKPKLWMRIKMFFQELRLRILYSI